VTVAPREALLAEVDRVEHLMGLNLGDFLRGNELIPDDIQSSLFGFNKVERSVEASIHLLRPRRLTVVSIKVADDGQERYGDFSSTTVPLASIREIRRGINDLFQSRPTHLSVTFANGDAIVFLPSLYENMSHIAYLRNAVKFVDGLEAAVFTT
jgi:hypothetical protein